MKLPLGSRSCERGRRVLKVGSGHNGTLQFQISSTRPAESGPPARRLGAPGHLSCCPLTGGMAVGWAALILSLETGTHQSLEGLF